MPEAILELIPANTKPRVTWDDSAMIVVVITQIKQTKPKEEYNTVKEMTEGAMTTEKIYSVGWISGLQENGG